MYLNAAKPLRSTVHRKNSNPCSRYREVERNTIVYRLSSGRAGLIGDPEEGEILYRDEYNVNTWQRDSAPNVDNMDGDVII